MIPTLVRKFTLLLVLFTLCVGASSAGLLEAQVVDLDKDRTPVAPLPALWRFHAGDNAAWVDPNFDDSGWSLLRDDTSWQGQGYPGYEGIGWYRFRIIAPARLDGLSLDLPFIANSYEVFADGARIGGYGKMPPHPQSFVGDFADVNLSIPKSRVKNSADPRTIIIAIRVWYSSVRDDYPGGGPLSGEGAIGGSREMESRRAYDLAQVYRNRTMAEILVVLQTLAVIATASLFLLRRKDYEYLWFSLKVSCTAAQGWIGAFMVLHAWPVPIFLVVFQSCYMVNELFYIGFIYQLIKPRRIWLLKLAVTCTLLYYPFNLQGSLFPSALNSETTGLWTELLDLPWCVWMITTLVEAAWRKSPEKSRRIDARLLSVPILLRTFIDMTQSFFNVSYYLHLRKSPVGLNILIAKNPFPVTLIDATSTFFLLSVLAILVLRFTRSRGQQERYATEVEGARHVQQFLIPEDLPQVPGLTIESDYRPAREVGGDFFQIIPDASDGSALVLVGDVAGKGMQAGMLATLLVGSMRTAATFTRDPAVILSTLNNRLCGKGNATCLALRIEADGRATLVNAGHLPPYCNGVELPMEGALPLGTIAGIEFPILHFQINPGDTLTLISDGILEAQKPDGELFGFERIAELLSRPSTASSLANAAQDFGQEDDITVLTIARRVLPISLAMERPELQM